MLTNTEKNPGQQMTWNALRMRKWRNLTRFQKKWIMEKVHRQYRQFVEKNQRIPHRADRRIMIDIEAYLHCKLSLKANEQYDSYEMDVSDADIAAMEREEREAAPPEGDKNIEEITDNTLTPEPDNDEAFDYGAFF